MISYEVYKILHIMTLLTLLFSVGFSLNNVEMSSKRSFRIIYGVVSFLVFVGGMGLIARIGIKHGEAFPAWIMVKIVAWIVLNLLIVVILKTKNQKTKYFCAATIAVVVFIAVMSAITKML